ncbi:MAG TPA: hypothetical protein VMS93_05290, partial [Candidatus Saccharimonadales bacterium]|nr:hypothetical protein [Candidatus Saccharimonadales bacterium]
NRTIQTRWNAEWRYFTGAVVVDVSTSPTLALEPAVGIAPPPGVERREFISEQVLAGFPEGATLAEGAQDQRDELVRRLPEIPPPVAFEAAGVRFFQLRARPAGGPAARR